MTAPTPPSAPIVVRESAALTMFWTCVRIALFVAAGMLLRSFIPDVVLGAIMGHLDSVVAGVLTLVPTLWVSLRATLQKHRKMRALAEAAPDTVAQVK